MMYLLAAMTAALVCRLILTRRMNILRMETVVTK